MSYDINADTYSPVSRISARAFGCGTLYHVRNADSRHQERISVFTSTAPLKYRTSVSPESVNAISKSKLICIRDVNSELSRGRCPNIFPGGILLEKSTNILAFSVFYMVEVHRSNGF